MRKCILAVMAVMLSAVAFAIDYDVVVVDKGEALVVVSVEGEGLHTLPLPEDVIDAKIEGALYLIKDQKLQLSIGSTKKALVAYKTDHLTLKEQSRWNFAMNLPKGSDVAIHLPKNTIIHRTQPEALIQSSQYKTVAWQDQDGPIEIEYSFEEDGSLAITANAIIEQQGSSPKTFVWMILVALAGILLFAASILAIKYKKPKKTAEQIQILGNQEDLGPTIQASGQIQGPIIKRSEKETILKTLSENELNVVSLLMNNNGEMKRNILEKESNIAKSSLASTLYNLERKNIVSVNKTYAVHFVQLTEWFSKL